ncbi:MAG TPA: IS630 family transposase [Roseiarcus sp.]
MPSAVRLREDYSADELRTSARRSKNVNQSRRLLSLAAVRDGMDRGAAAKIGGMDRQTLRDWVHRFNAAGPEGLFDNWTEGPKPRLSAEQLAQFAQIVEAGPDREVDGVVRWRRLDLKRVIAERFGVDFHPRYVGKLLKKLGFSHISARPRHPAQDERIVEAFKKNFPHALKAHLDGLPEITPVEIWFEDEARIGQKNGQVRQWARRGTRPRQPADQRYDNAYLFGAICPARGVGAALALPYADADMMQLHLDEISRNVAAGAHAVLLLDRAGWHTTSKLDVPDNITPIFLPSRAPELNPVENVWQYLRQNWLSNTVFENYDAIVDAACAAWRKLIAQPETITSIGMRDWAHVGQPL